MFPQVLWSPQDPKPDTPLRPIVSSCGSVTYGVAKELAKILKPLVGKSPHHITSTQDFVEQAKHIKLEPGECLSSYDVSALFTSVPIDQHNQGSIGQGQHPQGKNCYGSWGHYPPIGVLSKTHTSLSKASSLNRLRVLPWVQTS